MTAAYRVAHECGFTGTYRTEGLAARSLRAHSCDKARAEAAAAARARAREATIDRTPVACEHTRTTHTHGTHACYVLDRCRCLPCSVANAAYEEARKRAKVYGAPPPYVDAEPARAHLRALSAAGVGWKRVAMQAGLPGSTVYPLLYGKGAGKPPRARARKTTVDAILAVPMPTLDRLGGGAVVDSTGTTRRLRALAVLGWSAAQLAARGNLDPQVVRAMMRGDRATTARTALAVRALYEDLWDQAPTPGTSATRARAHAARQGWAPPLAWDDDTIDLPDASPADPHDASDDELVPDEVLVARAVEGTATDMPTLERVEAVRRLAALGLADRAIAAKVGVSDRTVFRDRQMHGIPSAWAS